MDVQTQRAINLIATGEPIPVDLYAELLELGVDVSELERKYNR